jgi:class 3 adenylate cyclase/tetratricopeptide (TPR) repeat protein
MFTDVVGSTELASTLDPEDWHDVLDAYQHRVASIVRANGGVIAQFQGDGAVAYFGYPEAVESAGRDAVSAGLDIVDDIAHLGAELAPALGVKDLRARAGIHTGEVVVAAITAGGNERLPDVWGQVPNLAARLQGACEPGQVVISSDTASLVSGFFELVSLGTLTIKGIAQPVPAFRAMRRSPARHRLEARTLTTFVSRADALAWLHDQWSLARQGQARLALVTGEPGIGKSRLFYEFGAGLSARGHSVRTLFCSRRGSLSPLEPFTEVMDTSPATPADADAWADALGRLGPLLLVVEDAHWADPSTLEAVHLIARRATPVFVLMSARPEVADNPHVRPVAHLSLERFSTEEAYEMLDLLPESAGMEADVRDALIRRADGVPLFLEELARGVAEAASDVNAAMPATLSEVITARLDRLGEAKRVAQSAAVIGRTFERPVLLAVTGLDDATFDADLDRLTEHSIVEPTSRGDELQFRHALFHEASYRSVLRADRVRIHQAVGEMLVETGRAEMRPEIAAYHLGAAGRATEAVPLWKRAARTARQNSRFREAAAHERAVLVLVPQLPEEERERTELKSRSRLVMCLTAVDQTNPEALAESERVDELARRLGDQASLLRNYMVLVPWWQASARYERIDAILVEARRVAEELGDDWSVQLLAMYEATTRLWRGRPTEALELMRATYAAIGIALDGSLSDLPPLSSVELMVLGAPRVATALACWQCGLATQAWQIANEVLRFTTQQNVPQAVALAAVTSAIMAQLDGERELVAKLANEAWHVSDEVSTRQWRQWSQSLLWWAGDGLDEPELPGSHLRPYFLMLLADGPRIGEARALSLLDEAIGKARASGEAFCESEILRVRAGVLDQAGRLEDARENYVEAVASARAQGARMLELRALTDLARLSGASDDVRDELRACALDVAMGGPSKSLTEALSVLGPA